MRLNIFPTIVLTAILSGVAVAAPPNSTKLILPREVNLTNTHFPRATNFTNTHLPRDTNFTNSHAIRDVNLTSPLHLRDTNFTNPHLPRDANSTRTILPRDANSTRTILPRDDTVAIIGTWDDRQCRNAKIDDSIAVPNPDHYSNCKELRGNSMQIFWIKKGCTGTYTDSVPYPGIVDG